MGRKECFGSCVGWVVVDGGKIVRFLWVRVLGGSEWLLVEWIILVGFELGKDIG